MKLIDKLFKKLGYTRTEIAHMSINYLNRQYEDLVKGILNTENLYHIWGNDEEKCYVVRRHIPGTCFFINIKKFYFKDDTRYALLCARELVEELKKRKYEKDSLFATKKRVV